jgi:hypothetical protein
MHLQPVFHGCRAIGGAVAELLVRDGICLPSGSRMTAPDLSRVITAVRGVAR